MKKTLNTIKDVLVWALLIASILIMVFTLVSVRTFDQNERNLFGFKMFIVQSDSMSATDFNAGDVVLVKEVENVDELNEGDIISFVSQNSHNSGETVTHKIRSKTTDANGNPGFITYGTTTNVDDEMVVTYPNVLGKYVGKIPYVGTFFAFLKTTPGYIICIFVPFTLLILYNGVSVIMLFRRYRKEQLEELKAEKLKIAEERQRSEEMMKELLELKKQLADQVNNKPKE